MTSQEAIRLLREMQQSSTAIARAIADERGQFYPREVILAALRTATAALVDVDSRERAEGRAIAEWNAKVGIQP